MEADSISNASLQHDFLIPQPFAVVPKVLHSTPNLALHRIEEELEWYQGKDQDLFDEMCLAEKAVNAHRLTKFTDFKRVQRRKGTDLGFMEEFAQGIADYNIKMRNDSAFGSLSFLRNFVNLGHAHSDADSERDGDPWDEFNKTDKYTCLEKKLSKKINQFPHIDLHSRTPYLDDHKSKKQKKREDPKQILQKMVSKEHQRQMAQIHNCNQIKMGEEVKLFQRYLRLNKKLAFSKNWDKQRRIVEPMLRRHDYAEFDFSHSQDMLKADLAVFQKYANFDVESLESEEIRQQI